MSSKCFLRGQVALSARAIQWTPEALGSDAPAAQFSEARAMRTVRQLTDEVGLRRVCPSLHSTP